jgi:pyridoxine 5-phosphate synthase
VELHTGEYCREEISTTARAAELERLRKAAELAASAGLEVHAGHGLAYDTVGPIAEIPQIVELNIGHFLIGEAIFTGLRPAIERMRALMDRARAEASGRASA